jgi:hypothetical protein
MTSSSDGKQTDASRLRWRFTGTRYEVHTGEWGAYRPATQEEVAQIRAQEFGAFDPDDFDEHDEDEP